MGNKAGYAAVILDALGLRSGEGAAAYLWAEADPDVRALLRAYPDAAMLTRIAEIIRGWADEEPRALWERLRAERKARGPVGDADDAAGWIINAQWSFRCGEPDSGFNGGVADGRAWNAGADETADRCTSLAAYATIAASNRLINVAGPDLMNTGAGGTRFGGAEFATPAADVAAGFERVAGWMYVNANSWKGEGDHWKDPSDEVIAAGITVCRSSAGIAADLERASSRWPPVAVLSAIPTAADVARWLGTPGDLSGVVVYSDPDYRDTTGYGNTCRDMIPDMAREFDALGAVVCISEQEPIPELPGWHATEITGGRKGQARTFSKQKAEWLTMNRPPAHTVAVQHRLFG
jgi:hypothetical protein